MDALKRQVMQMNKDIEAAKNRRKDLERIDKKIEERANIAEAEARSLQARIKMTNEKYEKCCTKLSEREAQLRAKGEEADDSEKVRKNLEVMEFEHVDDIAMTERKLADAKRHAEEICKKHNDAVVRYNKLKVDLSNALGRLNTAESRMITLQEECDYETRKLLKLEYRDNCYDKRADYFEEKMEDLEQGYGAALQIEDENLLIAKQLTAERDMLRSQVQTWNKRVTNLKRELEGTLADINKF